MAASLNGVVSPEDPTTLYDLEEEIATGAFGVVLKGRQVSTGEPVAVKICNTEDEDNLNDLAAEVAVLKKVQHQNIVKFFGAYKKDKEVYIAMELCVTSTNTLYEVLEHGLREPEIAYIIRETLKALSYLHENGIIHRDVKAPNILINSKGEIKLTDFGVVAILNQKDEKRTSFVGTPWWMAPEMILGCQDINYAYDYKVDIWAIGITCIELAEMKPPLDSNEVIQVMYEVINNDPPGFAHPEKFSQNFRSFVTLCLEKTILSDQQLLLFWSIHF
eukprot:TRINITY_DN587_c0_g5_i1.p1 TRINITY_DN587_c0_g5~~TRINITY_DN587_c0_g5_i1.p1  ORF type:complete len:275 (-),score=81.57 TRINITY_DN587_c0_g5_i1:402-1226(-)